MNKQQLASRIWETANNIRSKIPANEYKDYILSFMFYKFLSDRIVNFLKKEGFTEEDIKKELNKNNNVIFETIRNKYGYFIEYKNLFSTWIKNNINFDISNVSDALSDFNKLLKSEPRYEKLFEKIFNTLQTGLSKLGKDSISQTKACKKIINLINTIEIDDNQGYDVLGFVYEYLISNFAANAGKKAGEFYTPHEISVLMSEIVSNHLKEEENIKIYDPTSGSGSLLINIGKSISKYIKPSNIKYYAQELKEDTYSLTRMNLIMRGIKPENIECRNADTLIEDWPILDGEPLLVNAVISNPPYSQKWKPEEDRRFSNYGLAPKTKSDYAFLLHNLYHINNNGIVAIVLPHGVLFRGGDEAKIRRNLIENGNIDTIIGLPANIFYGTGIPTIIMILKKEKKDNNILFIDASKGFIKSKDKNKLRARDIKKILCAVINRENTPNYSRVVNKEEIVKNEYNLNIPRYIDTTEKQESYDLYATMFGGIPNSEINDYDKYWQNFPSLKEQLFEKINTNYSKAKTTDIKKAILNNKDMQKFLNNYQIPFSDFNEYLYDKLIKNIGSVNISLIETEIADNIFSRLNNFPLIDKYEAYQILNDSYLKIAADLDIIQTSYKINGLKVLKEVVPNTVLKKNNDDYSEVQEGWKGLIISFDLIQKEKLSDKLDNIKLLEDRIEELSQLKKQVLEELSDDEKLELGDIINEDNTKLNKQELSNYLRTIKNNEILENSLEAKLFNVNEYFKEETTLNKELKTQKDDINESSIKAINELSDNEALELLTKKWIKPLVENIINLPLNLISNFAISIEKISKKYETTYTDLEKEIENTEKQLSDMIDELEADDFDKKGLLEFQKLLRGV